MGSAVSSTARRRSDDEPGGQTGTRAGSRSGGAGLTPAQRTLRARLAAHALHARVTDPAAHTAAARRAFLDRFDREVDPQGVLSEPERRRRAEHARKAYFTRLALASARARQAR